MIVVYSLINITKQKMYIGSTSNLQSRINRHISELNAGTHHNYLMQSDHLSEPCHYFVEVYYRANSREEAYSLEKYAIESSVGNIPIYNILIGGRGGDALSKHPHKEDLILKRTSTQKLRMTSMTEEEKRNIYGRPGKQNGMYGKTHTAEARAKIVEANLGRVSPMRGKPMSESHKENFMNYVNSRDYVGSKNPFYGKKHSKETIEKIRNKNKGIAPPCARPISIDGVYYPHATAASKSLNIPAATIRHRCGSPNPRFSNYVHV